MEGGQTTKERTGGRQTANERTERSETDGQTASTRTGGDQTENEIRGADIGQPSTDNAYIRQQCTDEAESKDIKAYEAY